MQEYLAILSGLPAIDSRRAFSVSRDWRECTTRRLLLIIFKWISVQDNSSGWGTEGSEGRWVQQACIGRSVILNYQVCRDNSGRVSPSPRSSLSHNAAPPRPPRRRLTGTGARTDGRAARCSAALAGRRHSTAHEDDAAAVLRTVQFHAVTKYVNTVICNNIAVTYVKSREISQ